VGVESLISASSINLYRDVFPGRAIFDTAISHAMLRQVAATAGHDHLRLYSPDDALLFSSLDARRPGYRAAVAIAREAGFDPVIRLAGGHAAVFLKESLAFAWASSDRDAHLRIQPRFERLTQWVVEALCDLGLDARVGEVPGEYCPGEYSVNIGGRVKVMGVGQRVIRGGAHVGGVITIGHTDRLRGILIPIYEALGLDFAPETAGGLADFSPAVSSESVIEALLNVLRREGMAIEASSFDTSQHRAAQALAPLHSPERRPGAAAALRPSRGIQGTKTLILDPAAPQSEDGESNGKERP
jgi:lipoate-protein ligase A